METCTDEEVGREKRIQDQGRSGFREAGASWVIVSRWKASGVVDVRKSDEIRYVISGVVRVKVRPHLHANTNEARHARTDEHEAKCCCSSSQ